MRGWPYGFGVVVLSGFALAWCETGLTSLRHAGAILTPESKSTGEIVSRSSRWELADRAQEFRTALFDESLSLQDRVAAAELLRLSILIELRDDAPEVAHDLTDGTSALVDSHPDDRLALATHQDALRTLMWLSQQARLPDLDVDAALIESIQRSIEIDPENGHPQLLAAEIALAADRVEEARDALALAARAERIDSALRERFHVTVDFLTRRGVARSRAEELLTRGGYGAAMLRPGQELEALARDLVRKGGTRFANDENRWFEGYMALHGIGRALANSTFLVEDALDATHADTAFLDEMTVLVPRLIPRDESARRSMIDAKLRSLPRDGLHPDAMNRADRADRVALGVPEFVVQVLRRLETAHRELERTRTLDSFIAAQSILVWWSLLALAITAAAWIASWRGRSEGARVTIPGFFRFVVLGLPAMSFFFLVGSGIAPFDRGGGIDRVLTGLSEPNAILLLLPLLGAPFLLVPALVSAKYRRREVIVDGAMRAFAAMAMIAVLLSGVTIRSLDGMRVRRNNAVRDLWVETWTARFDAQHGITNS